MKISAALKVGILTILSICILVLGIMWLKGRSISIGEKIEVHFKDIDGMRPGSAVQMMGMRIGQVDEIEPVIKDENSYIIVRFVISEPDIIIPSASKISIQQSGIIGEKFLEIMPPFPETVFIPLEDKFKGTVSEGSKIELLLGDSYRKIGIIKTSKIKDTATLLPEERKYLETKKTYKIDFVITVPDIKIPLDSKAELIETETKGEYILRFTPPKGIVVQMPDFLAKYTIVEPLRMSDFLDIQIEAALALKQTNDKINDLFTEEFVDDIKLTFENTRDFSEKAGAIVNQVAEILDSSREDIKKLIASAALLSENMIVFSDNINDIIGDSEFKTSLISTVDSIKTTSDQVSIILEESKIQESLLTINSTTQDAAEIVKYVNNLTKNQKFTQKLEETSVNLNDLIIKLTKIVDSVEELTVEEKARLKEIIANSSEISKDVKEFSNKLNKRFLLLRLLF